jgi:hypothetical protein
MKFIAQKRTAKTVAETAEFFLGAPAAFELCDSVALGINTMVTSVVLVSSQ